MGYTKVDTIEKDRLDQYYYKRGDSFEKIDVISSLTSFLIDDILYLKEESQADKVREILWTGWVKRKDSNSIKRFNGCYFDGQVVLIGNDTYGYNDIVDCFESATFQEALDSIGAEK